VLAVHPRCCREAGDGEEALTRILVALSLTATSLFVVLPADATVTCPTGYVCFWENTGCSGQQVNVSDRHRISNRLANKMNNAASCAENDTEFAVLLYSKRDGRGQQFCLEPLGIFVSLAGFDDIASSTKVRRLATCP
jgi:hypothetical protein